MFEKLKGVASKIKHRIEKKLLTRILHERGVPTKLIHDLNVGSLQVKEFKIIPIKAQIYKNIGPGHCSSDFQQNIYAKLFNLIWNNRLFEVEESDNEIRVTMYIGVSKEQEESLKNEAIKQN